ncbi:MAG TPA: ABC transporter ATP-binding protein [Pyrinomonadaceae bacterium]|nr:ABC transporter ATP-binding protein [Pyrinomonadaceae bacterium]
MNQAVVTEQFTPTIEAQSAPTNADKKSRRNTPDSIENRGHGKELAVLWEFMRPQFPLTLQAVLCGLFRTGARLLPSFAAIVVFDYVLKQRALTLAGYSLEATTALVLAGAVVAVALTLEMPLVYFQHLFSEKAGQQTIYTMRQASFEKLQRLPASFFQVRSGGKMILRFIGDMSAILWLAGRGLVDAITDALLLIVVLGILFWLDPLLAAVSLLAVPFFAFGLWMEARPLREEGRGVRRLRSSIAGDLQEQFLLATTTRRLADRDKTLADFDKTSINLRDGMIGLAKLGGKLEGFATVASASMGAIILVFGAWLILEGRNTTGSLAVFFYLGALVFPVFRRLAQFNEHYNRAVIGLERVVYLLEVKEPLAGEETATEGDSSNVRPPLEVREGLIEAKGVTFRHTEKRGIVFENLSLVCPPGELTAIVAEDGAGKSTLASLLCGHLATEKGAVIVDGQNIAECDPATLGQTLVLVEEDSELFADNLLNNICYGWNRKAEKLKKAGRDRRVREVAEIVGLDEFIESLPQKYKTKAGQRGMRFSARQRMGIALMRALVRRPALIVIDGAEDFLKPETLGRLRGLLRESDPAKSFLKGIVILTADPLLALSADRVVVLEDGRVAECDTVEALRGKEDSAFYRLVAQRFVPEAASDELAGNISRRLIQRLKPFARLIKRK